MLTYLSRSIVKILRAARRELPAASEITPLKRPAGSDIAVAREPLRSSAASFVAGQGARLYSLDAFRHPPPPRPRAA